MSYVWKHFKKGEETITCKYCSNTFAARSSTTTLSYHVKNVHLNIIADETSSTTHQTVLCFKKRKISRDQQILYDKAISEFIWKDMRPLALVDGDGFRNMITTINPDCSVKHRNIYQNLIRNKCVESIEIVRKALTTAL